MDRLLSNTDVANPFRVLFLILEEPLSQAQGVARYPHTSTPQPKLSPSPSLWPTPPRHLLLLAVTTDPLPHVLYS